MYTCTHTCARRGRPCKRKGGDDGAPEERKSCNNIYCLDRLTELHRLRKLAARYEVGIQSAVDERLPDLTARIAKHAHKLKQCQQELAVMRLAYENAVHPVQSVAPEPERDDY
jgi:hypothetical protein